MSTIQLESSAFYMSENEEDLLLDIVAIRKNNIALVFGLLIYLIITILGGIRVAYGETG